MKDETHITFIVDRSGSMSHLREDTIGSINSFIEDQKKEPNKATFSLIQFGTDYEFIHKNKDLKDVSLITNEYKINGLTALLDAIGRGIDETGQYLESLSEEDRPNKVIFAILTDGLENSSKEYNSKQIKDKIEVQQKNYNWAFMFLGAEEDSIIQAESFGIGKDMSAVYKPTIDGTKFAMNAISAKVSTYRSLDNADHRSVAWTDQERESLTNAWRFNRRNFDNFTKK